MKRFLAIYKNNGGAIQATMISAPDDAMLPFGFEDYDKLADYDRLGDTTLVEMPDDPDFRPLIVDADIDSEVALDFLDL